MSPDGINPFKPFFHKGHDQGVCIQPEHLILKPGHGHLPERGGASAFAVSGGMKSPRFSPPLLCDLCGLCYSPSDMKCLLGHISLALYILWRRFVG